MARIVVEIRGGNFVAAHADQALEDELVVVDHDNLEADPELGRALLAAGVVRRAARGRGFAVNDEAYPYGLDMPDFEEPEPLEGARWYEVTLRVRVKVEMAELSGLQTGDHEGEPFHDELLPYVQDELEAVQRDASRTAIVEVRDLGEASPTGLQEG